MAVGTAEPERAHPRPTGRIILGRPRTTLVGDEHRRIDEVDELIRLGVVDTGHELAVPQHHDDFEQRSDARGPDQVTDAGLDRSDATELPECGMPPEGPGQGADLDRIAQHSTGAVGLDVADGLGLDSGVPPGVEQQILLRLGIRSGDAVGCTVVVHRTALYDGVDAVTVTDRVRQWLEDDRPHAFSPGGASGVPVEGSDRVVRGLDRFKLPQFTIEGHRLVGEAAQSTDDRDLALTRAQALAGLVNTNQPRGAGCVDNHAWSTQIPKV